MPKAKIMEETNKFIAEKDPTSTLPEKQQSYMLGSTNQQIKIIDKSTHHNKKINSQLTPR